MSTQEQQYIQGFNHGYLLTKHLPELVAKIVKGICDTTSEYISGFFSGKEEYELEYNRNQLIEFDRLRNQPKNQDKDLDRNL